MCLNKNEYVVDWLEFVTESIKHNWNLKGTIIKIENSMIDVYGKEYTLIIINKLKEYFQT